MDEALARADANYYEAFRLIATLITGGEVWERDGMLCAAWGGQIAAFNAGFVTRPLEDPSALVRQTTEFFDRRGLPFVVRVREGLDREAERAAESAGLYYSDTVPGMVLEPIRTGESVPGGLRIKRIDSERELETYVRVLSAAFEMPLELGRRFMDPRLLRTIDTHLYLGYLGDEAVATSALLISHRTAGVYNVSTIPASRRQGIGEAMTWQAVNEGARAGCLMSSLQASEMGYHVYERMGFRRITGYRTFHRPEA